MGNWEAWNLRYVDFQQGYGEEFWEMVCAHHLEGIVTKGVDPFTVLVSGRVTG